MEHVAEAPPQQSARPPLQSGQVVSVNDNTACIGFQQTDDVFEQDTFAATALADDGRNLPLVDVQVDAPQHMVSVEGFGDVLKLDEWRRHTL